MQKLTTFKQVRNFNPWSEAGNRASIAAAVACCVAFTAAFSNSAAHALPVSDPTVSIDANSTSDANKPTSSPDHPNASKGTDKVDAPTHRAIDKSAPSQPATADVTTTLSPTHVVKQSDDKMSTARKKEVEPLPNFHKVTEYLYRGGEPNPEGMHQLKKMGVKTLIDLRAQTEAAHDEAALAKKLGMKYINMTMTAEAPTKKQVETLLATIDSAKEKNEPVLVHCAHGSDRTGCMIGIWRVTRDNWAYDDTYKEMRKYYFGVKYAKLRDAVKERSTH